MESIVAQRIKAVLDGRQISIAAFAKRIGMQQVTCNRQIRGDQAVSLGVLEGFLREFPDVSAEWLLRGKGNMLLEDGDGFAKQQNETSQQKPIQDDGIWQAKYEELEKRYDQLLSILGGTMGKRNVS